MQSELLTTISPLTEADRIAARHHAADLVIARQGDKPTREQFRNVTIGKYPPWITALVVGLSFVVLLTAFLLSAMRLYHIGEITFYETLPDATSAAVAGYAVVLLAEAAAVLFTIALSVIGQSTTQRRILLVSVFASAALALSGNYYVALDNQQVTAFGILEAMLPPLLTLSTAYVLKELLLNIIERRHADQTAYEAALSDWKAATHEPEASAYFAAAYANALKEKIYSENSRGRGKTERQHIMDALPMDAWRVLVRREIDSDNWHLGIDAMEAEALAVDLDFLSSKPAPAMVAGNGHNGHRQPSQ